MRFGKNALFVVLLALSAWLPGRAAAHPVEIGDPSLGRLREVVFPSPSFGDVSLLVYTPPGYFAQGDQRRFPVVYWLHGSGGTHLQLEQALAALPVPGGGAAAKLDQLIGSGQLPPFLMVSINAPGGQWNDAQARLVNTEVPAFVDASYRTIAKRSGRGIEGFSLGSQGLSIYATARPDLYASISLLAGAFLTARWDAAKTALLREGSEVYLTIGDADPNFSATAAFSTQLANWGIPRTFDVVAGAGHNHVALYAARGVEILRWHAARFAATSLLDAGPDVYAQAALPATATLAATLSDPAGQLGPSPSFSWTQTDGPATAIIDSPASLSTAVHLPALGNYHFRITAQGSIAVADVLLVQLLDLGNSLALHLPLDGSLADASGNGRNANAGGAPAAVAAGRLGQALAFGGAGDLLSVPDFAYGPAFSVSLWMKAADLSGSSFQYLFSHNAFDVAPSCNLYLVETSAAFADTAGSEAGGDRAGAARPTGGEAEITANPRLRLSIRDSAGDNAGQGITADTVSVANGGWHHAALVVAPGAGNKLYYDGVQVAAGANGGDAYNPSTALFFAARSVTPDGRYFEGSLDEIRLYDRALLPEEVALLGAPAASSGAPQVAAGADRTTYAGAPLLLIGLAADPTPTGVLTVGWTKVSGPGAVTFADAAAPETGVSFAEPGVYLLRLSADDGQLQASDELTVTVYRENQPGLIAQWTFDEGSGAAAADRSGMAHHGTLLGSPTFVGPGHVGPGALRFRLEDTTAVQVDASPLLDFAPAARSFSVAAWLRLAPGKTGTLIARGSSAEAARALHFQVADLGAPGRSDLVAIVGGSTNANAVGIGPAFDDGAWHHAALVHDAATGKNQIYLDGAALGAPAASGAATASAVDLLIGSRRASGNTGLAQTLDGDLDDVRVYSRALAPAEVLLLFTGPPIPLCGPPSCLFGDGFELGDTSAWH